jgi:hypothetical protein
MLKIQEEEEEEEEQQQVFKKVFGMSFTEMFTAND